MSAAMEAGPGPGLRIVTYSFLLLLLAHASLAAPVIENEEEGQTQVQEYFGQENELGCYYNFQHYDEGDRIITNEPCLNCTCHNRMLMCYLRVCPFTKAIGQDCTVEKRADQCCPIINCPEVPVQLLTSSTTTPVPQIPDTSLGHVDDFGCRINDLFYTDGAQVPGNPNKPCELCYCIRNRTACVMQECTLRVEGCRPIYEEGVCCPVRYDCDYDEEPKTTTTEAPRPTPGLVLTTTTAGPLDCRHNEHTYADGASIETAAPCEHCYCMRGEIVCAVQECGTPLDKQNCTALPPPPGTCCPETYHCDENEIDGGSNTSNRQDRKHDNNVNITTDFGAVTEPEIEAMVSEIYPRPEKPGITEKGESATEAPLHVNEIPSKFGEEHVPVTDKVPTAHEEQNNLIAQTTLKPPAENVQEQQITLVPEINGEAPVTESNPETVEQEMTNIPLEPAKTQTEEPEILTNVPLASTSPSNSVHENSDVTQSTPEETSEPVSTESAIVETQENDEEQQSEQVSVPTTESEELSQTTETTHKEPAQQEVEKPEFVTLTPDEPTSQVTERTEEEKENTHEIKPVSEQETVKPENSETNEEFENNTEHVSHEPVPISSPTESIIPDTTTDFYDGPLGTIPSKVFETSEPSETVEGTTPKTMPEESVTDHEENQEPFEQNSEAPEVITKHPDRIVFPNDSNEQEKDYSKKPQVVEQEVKPGEVEESEKPIVTTELPTEEGSSTAEVGPYDENNNEDQEEIQNTESPAIPEPEGPLYHEIHGTESESQVTDQPLVAVSTAAPQVIHNDEFENAPFPPETVEPEEVSTEKIEEDTNIENNPNTLPQENDNSGTPIPDLEENPVSDISHPTEETTNPNVPVSVESSTEVNNEDSSNTVHSQNGATNVDQTTPVPTEHSTKEPLKITEPESETEKVLVEVQEVTETESTSTEKNNDVSEQFNTPEENHTQLPETEKEEDVQTEKVPETPEKETYPEKEEGNQFVTGEKGEDAQTEKSPQVPQEEAHPENVEETNVPVTEAAVESISNNNPESGYEMPVTELPKVTEPELPTSENTESEKPSSTETNFVPGEGSCFVDKETYANNSIIPPASKCQISCHCISSIVHCVLVNCPSAPPGMKACAPHYKESECCPSYLCDGESQPSPESGSHVTEEENEVNNGESSPGILKPVPDMPENVQDLEGTTQVSNHQENEIPENVVEHEPEKPDVVNHLDEPEPTESYVENQHDVGITTEASQEETQKPETIPTNEIHAEKTEIPEVAITTESYQEPLESSAQPEHQENNEIASEPKPEEPENDVQSPETSNENISTTTAASATSEKEAEQTDDELEPDEVTTKPITLPENVETSTLSNKNIFDMFPSSTDSNVEENETPLPGVPENADDNKFTITPETIMATTGAPETPEIEESTHLEHEEESDEKMQSSTQHYHEEKPSESEITIAPPTEIPSATEVGGQTYEEEQKEHIPSEVESTVTTTEYSKEVPETTDRLNLESGTSVPIGHPEDEVAETTEHVHEVESATSVPVEHTEEEVPEVTEEVDHETELTSPLPVKHSEEEIVPTTEKANNEVELDTSLPEDYHEEVPATTEENNIKDESGTSTEAESEEETTEKTSAAVESEAPTTEITDIKIDESPVKEDNEAPTTEVTQNGVFSQFPVKTDIITEPSLEVSEAPTQSPNLETSSEGSKYEETPIESQATEKETEESVKPTVTTELPATENDEEQPVEVQTEPSPTVSNLGDNKITNIPEVTSKEPFVEHDNTSEIQFQSPEVTTEREKGTEVPEVQTEIQESYTPLDSSSVTEASINVNQQHQTEITLITEDNEPEATKAPPVVHPDSEEPENKPELTTGYPQEISTENESAVSSEAPVEVSKPNQSEQELSEPKPFDKTEENTTTESTEVHTSYEPSTTQEPSQQSNGIVKVEVTESPFVTSPQDTSSHLEPEIVETEAPVKPTEAPAVVPPVHSELPITTEAPKQTIITQSSLIMPTEGYDYQKPVNPIPENPQKPIQNEDYDNVDEEKPPVQEYLPPEDDYEEEEEQPYGPGTCRYAGKVYVSAQQIPRDDPCDFCFCFRSDIICLQQSCPPPIPGCHEEPISGFCCPRYECHVRMATMLNVTSTTTTTTTTLPPHFLAHAYKGAASRMGCLVQGKGYAVGQSIPSASGPCLDCTCGGDGSMKCEPKVCTPEPMIRKMIVDPNTKLKQR